MMITASYNYRSLVWSVSSCVRRLALIMLLALSAVSCGVRQQTVTQDTSETSSDITSRRETIQESYAPLPAETTQLTLSMTDLRDRPLPSGAVYHTRKGRLEVTARVQADSLIIEAKTDSMLRQVERQIISQTDTIRTDKAQVKTLQERRRPSPIWAWLGYLPYILMVALGLWVYRYLYRNK